ncbi:MAG TPA: DUF2130 domain-containing protein [Thermoanaerobaculia bacterium]|nr:DUF2130 domain-containing protein [Thermoanaerobaculia bacterium]
MSPTTTAERCPWCGSTITHAKFLQIQNAIREDERRKLAAAEKAFRDRVSKELDAVKQQFEKQRKKELAEVRQILQKDRETALSKKEAEFARERDALQKKIVEISRRVKKAGGDVAEGMELDLFEELRGAFPEDQLARTKGKAGETLLHDVRYKGKSAGRIVIDPTPRAAWQHAFVTKLRQDQSESGADHAILSTGVFPAGKKELFVDSGVIVVAPARVKAMVDVLRKAMIAMHVAKLSEAERADKLGRLFKFITSPEFKRRFAEASDLADEALEIDVQEKRAHDNVWKKRGTVLTRIKQVLRAIDTDVSAIIEARDESEPPAPTPIRAAAFRVTSR